MKDKDLELIKKGMGLKKSSTTNKSQSSGVKNDQRGSADGLRLDLFSHTEKSGKKQE